MTDRGSLRKLISKISEHLSIPISVVDQEIRIDAKYRKVVEPVVENARKVYDKASSLTDLWELFGPVFVAVETELLDHWTTALTALGLLLKALESAGYSIKYIRYAQAHGVGYGKGHAKATLV